MKYKRRKQVTISNPILRAAEKYCRENCRSFSGWIEVLMRAELKRRDALPAQGSPTEDNNEARHMPDLRQYATKSDLDAISRVIEELKICFKAHLDFENLDNEGLPGPPNAFRSKPY